MPENFALPYNSTDNSGIGNTIFPETIEPLRQHNANLKELDTSDDFWKMWKLKELDYARKAKLASDITKDLSVNPDGALPEDIQNVFIPKMQDMRDRYAKIVQRVGGNNPALTRDPEYLQLMADKNALTGQVLQSKEHNKILTSDATRYNTKPEDWGDESLGLMAKARTLPLADRQKLITDNGGTFLKPVTTSYTADVLKNADNIAKTAYDIKKGSIEDKAGAVRDYETKTLNPDKLRAYVQGDLANFKKAKQVDAEFAQLNPQTQQVYNLAAQQYPDKGTAKEQYAYDVHRNLLGSTNTSKISDYTPERKEAAKDKKENDEALYLYDVANGILTGNMDYAANATKDANGNKFLTTRGANGGAENAGDFVSLDLKNMNYGTMQSDEGKTIPNKIISVTINPNTPNLVKLKMIDGDKTVDKTEFPEVLFNSNYGAGGYQKVKKAAEKRGNLQGNAIVTQPIQYKTGATAPVDATVSSEGVAYPKPKQIAKTQATEKLYVVNGKAYKESALKKQGYDIAKLEEYKP